MSPGVANQVMRPPAPPPTAGGARYFLGLDLGQRADFTALVGLMRTEVPGAPYRARFRYEVRGVRRWPLNTPYTAVAQDVAALVADGPLAGCTLGVDWTGVGQGVYEIVLAARPNALVRPVYITAGHAVRDEGVRYFVPKMELVGVVAALLDGGRLAIPPTVPQAATLGRELQAFKAKVTAAGNETAAADWRTRQHDDLVLGLAIAAWLGERRGQDWAPPSDAPAGRSLLSQMPAGLFYSPEGGGNPWDARW
jgi:hypothetical protein